MREIKFRGKRVSTGEWVYGMGIVPVQQNTYETGEYEIVRGVNYDELDYYHSSYDTYNVIPETIGQYTGMKDRNGREIYEGDIVNCRVLRLSASHSTWSQERNKEHGKCRVIPMEVRYDEPFTNCYKRFGGVELIPTKKGEQLIEEYEKPIGREKTKQTINWFNIHEEDLLEVVGNIYENRD